MTSNASCSTDCRNFCDRSSNIRAGAFDAIQNDAEDACFHLSQCADRIARPVAPQLVMRKGQRRCRHGWLRLPCQRPPAQEDYRSRPGRNAPGFAEAGLASCARLSNSDGLGGNGPEVITRSSGIAVACSAGFYGAGVTHQRVGDAHIVHQPENPVHCRFAQIGIHQNDAFAGLGEGNRQIGLINDFPSAGVGLVINKVLSL